MKKEREPITVETIVKAHRQRAGEIRARLAEFRSIRERGRDTVLLEEMVARAESLLIALELPYRIIEICAGDLGQSHHRSFDLEVWAPGSDRWLEVSSVSWFSDYQARRADIRYRPTKEKGTKAVHTLNGSALAVPRVWAAILENFRLADGSVAIPAALHPYTRGATVIPTR